MFLSETAPFWIRDDQGAKVSISRASLSDAHIWNAYVCEHPQATAYHLFAWGQAVAQAYGHELFYLIARDETKVVGVLPLIHLKLPFVLNELVALPFCDIGGCLSRDRSVEAGLLQYASQLQSKLEARSLQIRGPLEADPVDSGFAQLKSGKVRMLLALTDSSDNLFNNFKSKLRSQVRKSEKNGVVFRWAGEDGVEAFYSVLCRNMRNLGSPVHSIELFRAVMQHFEVHARIGLTEFEGKCIGAGLILSTGKQVSIPWASTLGSFNKLAPNMLLYWNCLKYAAESGAETFDFGRSTEGAGTFRFKKQWGALPKPLPWYVTVSGKPGGGKSDSSRGRAAAIWQMLPLPVANYFGPIFRKYISL